MITWMLTQVYCCVNMLWDFVLKELLLLHCPFNCTIVVLEHH